MRGDGRVDDKAGYLKQCGQSVRGDFRGDKQRGSGR